MLKTRVITALFLLAGLSYALFGLSAVGWVAFVAFVIGLAGWEWGRLAAFSPPACVAYGLLGASLGFLLGSWGAPLRLAFYSVSVLFWIACAPFFLLKKPGIGRPVLAALMGWLVLLPAAMAMVQLRERGAWVLMAVMAAVWVADIAAYFTGRAFGRRKLAPAISPGKTWEGAAGAVVGVLAYGLVLAAFQGRFSIGEASLVPPFLLLFTALSIEGDLFESLLKRQAGIKDSSALLPGHGGILDRIDSLTSTLPLAGLVLSVISL